MPTRIYCDCNCSTERYFLTKKDLSKNASYSVFFDLTGSGTPTEKRQLRILDKATGNLLLTVNLNDNAGLKPLKGLVEQYKPHVNPNPRVDTSCKFENERVFYADINLTDDPGISVVFKIEPDTTTTDRRHYLHISSTVAGFPAALSDFDLDLNDSGGKKPLEGPVFMEESERKESAVN